MGKFFKSDTWNIFYLTIFNLALRIFLLNSPPVAYFDEKAFYLEGARSYLTGFTDPNFEHPPLGKEIIALGIKIFGDNLWGWRLSAVLFGTLGVVVTYLLAKKLFKSTKIAFLAAVLLTFDSMWFVNSRIGTIEIFQATFILLTSYFFWEFTQQRDYKNILLAGSFLGASLATKWSALFFLIGLTIFILVQVQGFGRKLVIKIALGLLTALLVYLGSYLPYLQHHSLSQFWETQLLTYQFHTQKLPSQAKGSASPLEWLTDPAEIYYQKDNHLVISLVNPALFYGGLISIGYWFLKGFRSLERGLIYLLVIIVSLYLPWFLVGRYTLFYYFLPVTPFLAILLAKTIFAEKLIKLKESWWKWLQFSIVTGNLLGFIICYPLLVGLPVTSHYLAVILSAKIH